MNQWLISPAGGPFGPWPGIVEAVTGRVIAHVVPDEATAQELVGLRAALIAATARADAAEAERDKWKGLAEWARAELVERTSEYVAANSANEILQAQIAILRDEVRL